jgi:ssDNA-binding Zn-finger/Zn-ribbon topoisomerase 1
MNAIQELGTCPSCGDDLWIFKTRTGHRLARCVNEHCPKKLQYSLPKRGKLEVTADLCPKFHVNIVVVIPHLNLKTRFKADQKKTYFWSMSPCFMCTQQSRCVPLQELKEEYLGGIVVESAK